MGLFVHHDYSHTSDPMRHLITIVIPPANYKAIIAEVNEWCIDQFGPPFNPELPPVPGDCWSQRYESWIFCDDSAMFTFKLRWF